MRLKGIPALYSFNGSEANPVPSGDGTYSLPYIGNKIAYHETRAAMNYEGEVIGEFVTFRYTSSTHQLWSLWRDGEQIVKDIDLNLFSTNCLWIWIQTWNRSSICWSRCMRIRSL